MEIIENLRKMLDAGIISKEDIERAFPQLAESEDERIRKDIVFILNEYSRMSEEQGFLCNESVINDALAYLERQKEQKPAEWSEEDNEKIERLRSIVNDCAFRNDALDVNGDYCEGDYGELDNWLKSLRPQPQRRNTYYDIIHGILDTLKDIDFMKITPEHRVSLLNDIRVKCKNADECAAILDEPHWKPSEEQMEWLESAVRLSTDKPRIHGIIISLYEQLKSL